MNRTKNLKISFPFVKNAVFMVFEGKYLETYTLWNLIVQPSCLIEPKLSIFLENKLFKWNTDFLEPQFMKGIEGASKKFVLGIRIKQIINLFLLNSTREIFCDYFWSARTTGSTVLQTVLIHYFTYSCNNEAFRFGKLF